MSRDTDNSFNALVNEAVTVGIRHIGIAVYSSGKVLKYLMNKGYAFDVASDAVKLIVERGYIDDYRAGRKIINSRVNKKQESKRMIYQRLLNDGINNAIANDLVRDLEDDKITCRYLIESLYPVVPEGIDAAFINSIIKKAYQRGYSPELSTSVIRIWAGI